MEDARWGGLRFEEIFKSVKIKAGAEYVIFHALGETSSQPEGQRNYIESFPLKKLLDPREEILLALDLDEKPLTHERGAPLRVVAPYQLGYKSIKFVTAIEFSSVQRAGWWSLGNAVYPVDAPVPPGRLRKKKGLKGDSLPRLNIRLSDHQLKITRAFFMPSPGANCILCLTREKRFSPIYRRSRISRWSWRYASAEIPLFL